jgi:hypothetical protein
MRFFSSKPKAFIDRARGDAQASELQRAVAAKQWQVVEAALSSTHDASRREFLIDSVTLDTQDLGWVDAWVQARPDQQAGRLAWGACAVQYAWHIRTGREPQNVSPEQFRGFHDWLLKAQEQLQHAATMDPTDSAPWVALLWAAVGLELPLEEATSRWQAVFSLNPATELGAQAYTTFTGPRWNGTAELMWSFVRGLLEREPEGSPRWTLVPSAHLEQWVAERMSGHARVHASRYFQQPQVQAEIKEAYGRYLGSSSRRPSPLEPQNREVFACTYYLMGERDELRRQLEQVGPGIQVLPWGFLGSPLVAYQGAREAAGLR